MTPLLIFTRPHNIRQASQQDTQQERQQATQLISTKVKPATKRMLSSLSLSAINISLFATIPDTEALYQHTLREALIDADWLVFESATAAHILLKQFIPGSSTKIAARSQSISNTITHCGITPHITTPAPGTHGQLFQALQNNADLPRATVLIAQSHSADNELEQLVTNEAYNCVVAKLYHQKPQPLSPEEIEHTQQLIQQHNKTAICFTDALSMLSCKQNLPTLTQLPAIVSPSINNNNEPLAEIAKKYGWEKIVQASEASDASLIEASKKIFT